VTPLLSQADHRLNHVEPWSEQGLHPWRGGTEPRRHPLDVSDDRLATVLAALREDDRWRTFEGALTRPLRRVYALQPERVRLDSPTASGYWAGTADGRFQCGHRKEPRPNLPPVTGMVAALDPLGVPVATDVMPGQRAADPVDVPAITRVRESLGRRGRLDVGDGTMGAVEPRAVVQAGADDSWCPRSESQLPPGVWESDRVPGWTGHHPLTRLTRVAAPGRRPPLAEGDERLEPLTVAGAGEAMTWTARRLVVRSRHLAQAQAALAALNARRRGQRRCPDPSALRVAVDTILARDRVQGLRLVRYQEQWWERSLRRYGRRAATGRMEWEVQVTVSLDEEAVAAAVRQLGWRVYVTTQLPDQLSLQEAVLAYRSAYLVERAMGRLKGRPLSLTPMNLERDDHATGLIRLLSIGLRVLTLLEFGVRRRLAAAKTTLGGLYVGNPTRATAHPTAERLLEAFQGLTLTIIREGRRRRRHLTPLSRVHQRILALLDFSVDIYTRLCADSQKPP
jgi:transposase